MKIQPYLEKLESSKPFKEFQGKNPKAYFSAGFFVLDFEENSIIHQIDYYIPETRKMATFILDSDEVELKESESANEQVPAKITD